MQLHRARKEIEGAGARVVLIGQATPRDAAHFRRRHGIDLPVLADEARASYELAGTKMASVGELLGPRVVAKGLLTSARNGVVQGRTVGHAAQLGGTILVRQDGSVAWTHISEDAGDNASPAQILQALRSI